MVVLGTGDGVVMAVLFCLTLIKCLRVTWRSNRIHVAGSRFDFFFLADRNMPWWAVGLSTFASNIGPEHFIGQVGAAAISGMPVAIYEWSAALMIFLLGFALSSMYLKLDLTTVPEWFEKRFNKSCRLVVAAVSIVIYIITKIAASLYGGAVLLYVILGIPMWASVPITLTVTTVYAASGGLAAVMYTDALQAVTFLIGGTTGMIVAFMRIGGIKGLYEAVDRNEATIGYFMSSLRSPSHGDYPWTGMLIGHPLSSFWYWCIDQTMVQRVLAAKSASHAQAGCAMAAYLQILPPFMLVFPGMIARVFYEECQRTGGQDFPEWCNTSLDDGAEASKAYPFLIAKTFPDGIRGLVIVSVVLAMMSSLDSVFNSLSTLVTKDMYRRFINDQASDARQLAVGRSVTVIAAIVGLAWLPMIKGNTDGLYWVTQSAVTHMSPTLVAVFLLGLTCPRINGQGALAGLIVGFALGIGRFVAAEMSTCEEDDVSSFMCMNFKHMALVLFAVAVMITAAISFLTPPPEESQLQGTTIWWSLREEATGEDNAGSQLWRHQETDPSLNRLLLGSCVALLAIMLALCVGWGYSAGPTEPAHSGPVIAGVAVVVYFVCVFMVGMAVYCWGRQHPPEAAAGRTRNKPHRHREHRQETVSKFGWSRSTSNRSPTHHIQAAITAGVKTFGREEPVARVLGRDMRVYV